MRAARSETARLIVPTTTVASLPAPGTTIVDSRGGPSGRPLGPKASQRAASVTAPVSSASKREISTAIVTPGGGFAALSTRLMPAGSRAARSSANTRPTMSSSGQAAHRARRLFQFVHGAREVGRGAWVVAEDGQGRTKLVGGGIELREERAGLHPHIPGELPGIGERAVELLHRTLQFGRTDDSVGVLDHLAHPADQLPERQCRELVEKRARGAGDLAEAAAGCRRKLRIGLRLAE